MNVWNRVVEDLEAYGKRERSKKSIVRRILDFLAKGSCRGDCNQGRAPCNCERRYE